MENKSKLGVKDAARDAWELRKHDAQEYLSLAKDAVSYIRYSCSMDNFYMLITLLLMMGVVFFGLISSSIWAWLQPEERSLWLVASHITLASGLVIYWVATGRVPHHIERKAYNPKRLVSIRRTILIIWMPPIGLMMVLIYFNVYNEIVWFIASLSMGIQAEALQFYKRKRKSK